ncbi:MAG: hypothetical protein AAGE52_38990 [Myxococcota bacterium]
MTTTLLVPQWLRCLPKRSLRLALFAIISPLALPMLIPFAFLAPKGSVRQVLGMQRCAL